MTTTSALSRTAIPAPPDAPHAGAPPARRPHGRGETRAAFATVVVAVVVVGGLAAGFRGAWGLVIGFAVAIPLERAFQRHDYPILRPGLRTDIVHFLFTHFLEAAAIAVAVVLCWLPLHLLTWRASEQWLAGRRPVVVALLALVVLDFGYYWQHRLAHSWGFLWRFHAVHHSSERLDWLAAARLHPFEAFVGGFIIAPPIILLGFPPAYLGLFAGLTTLWAIINHANVRWRLRWMDRLYPSPEYHHWHHSNEPDARNKNFGLPLWDTLFGTYFMPAGRRPQVYGIDEPMPDGWFAQLAHPFRTRPTAAPDGPPPLDATVALSGRRW